jgi:peroxiredoxin
MAITEHASERLKFGDPAPLFSLLGVDGHPHSLERYQGKSLLVVVFSCSHCPYVQAYEDRLVDLQRDYAERGVQVLAINSNDAVAYPEDGFDAMQRRAQDKRFNFPYLHDPSQEVARAFGATHTPQLFVFDHKRRLRYSGKIDDNWQDPRRVTRRYLREALDSLLNAKEPPERYTHAIGCTIKWKR